MESTQKSNWLIELSHEKIWSEKMENIPSMICYSYAQLKSLAENGQVYGVMLQCKDLYELLYRIPLIMAMIVMENDSSYKEKQGYSEVIRLALEQPMSMGRWNELARKFISKKNKTLILPYPLPNILKCTQKLYEKEISEDNSDVVNWRNNSVGHGALKFEDDTVYQEEIRNLLKHLYEYFNDSSESGISALYKSAYFFAGNTRLTGDIHYKKEYQGKIQLCIQNTICQASNYVSDEDLRLYLFESFFSRQKLIKLSSYTDGHDEFKDSKYLSDLYERFVVKGISDFSVNNGIITREQEQILELLTIPAKYVRPERLIEKLQDTLDETEHGVISLFMERGTGKTAFANRMSGLFNKQSMIKSSFSRCYHIQNASLRGISDFINAMNFNFRHNYDPAQDLYSNTDELLSLSLGGDEPEKDLAEFLNYYHRQYNKEYTILLIDGIDEINEQTKMILDYIPSRELLNEGVFIILLSRFKDEKTVQGSSRLYIEKADNLSDSVIQIRRNDEINTDVMRAHIEEWKKKQKNRDAISTNELIEKADRRFLYLKAYLELSPEVLLDKTDETRFAESYLKYVMTFYGPIQIHKLQEIAVTIALFPEITLKKYREYLNSMDLTYEFIGMLNDLMPLITVVHINGEDAYEFADQAYAEYILNNYADVVKETLDNFQTSCNARCEQFEDESSDRLFMDPSEPEWNSTNNAITFYSESFLTIFSHGISYPFIRNYIYSHSIGIIQLYTFLADDRWAENGYGLWLKNRLFERIMDNTLYSLRNPDDKAGQNWIKHLFQYTLSYSTDPLSLYSFKVNLLKSAIREHPQVDEILQLLCQNTDTKNIPGWFWLFKYHYTPEIDQLLERNSLKDLFVDFIVTFDTDDIWYLEGILENGHFTAQQEARILNTLVIDKLLRGNYAALDKNETIGYLEQIRDKGYSIDVTDFHKRDQFNKPVLFNDKNYDLRRILESSDPDTIIHYLKNESMMLDTSNHQIREAINYLLDFPEYDSPFFFDFPMINQAAGIYLSLDYNQSLAKNPMIIDLHKAFYKRLCHEKKYDHLVSFLEDNKYLNRFITDILKSETDGPNELYEQIMQWIEYIEPLADDEHKSIICILSGLYVAAVKLLEEQGQDEESICLKEKYICTWDTKAFFASYFAGHGDPEMEPAILYTSESLIYCTRNALSLLQDYRTRGMNEAFNSLLSRFEESIPLIDNNQRTNEETRRMCELAKMQFYALRTEFHISNKFDSWLQSTTENHLNAINNICHSLSRNTDYYTLHYHLYQLLENTWQTFNWTECISLCNELQKTLQTAMQNKDETIHTIIQEQITTLQDYQEYFEYMKVQESQTTYKGISKRKTDEFYSSYCCYDEQLDYIYNCYLDYVKEGKDNEIIPFLVPRTIYFDRYK